MPKADERHGINAASLGHLRSCDWAPVMQLRVTIYTGNLFQQSSIWGMCTALMGQLHSIVGTYMHQRLRNCAGDAEKFYCSVRLTVKHHGHSQ
jgi:hypothetical protein